MRIRVGVRSNSTADLCASLRWDSLLRRAPQNTLVGYAHNRNVKLEVEVEIWYKEEIIPFSPFSQFDYPGFHNTNYYKKKADPLWYCLRFTGHLKLCDLVSCPCGGFRAELCPRGLRSDFPQTDRKAICHHRAKFLRCKFQLSAAC